MRFVHRSRVRFGHCDPAGIAYYPRFFEWFHDAFEAMFESIGGRSYAAILRDTGTGFPAVSTACEWRLPSRFGDLVDIEVFVSRLGEKSATFEYRVMREKELLATASIKVVAMDMVTHTSVGWPKLLMPGLTAHSEALADAPDTERLRR